jgi:hypothetical protein
MTKYGHVNKFIKLLCIFFGKHNPLSLQGAQQCPFCKFWELTDIVEYRKYIAKRYREQLGIPHPWYKET